MDNMFLLFTSAGWHTVSWTICDNSLERPESRLNIFDMTFELHRNLNIGTTWKSLKQLVGEGGLVRCTQVQQRQEKGPLTRGSKGDMTNGDLHPRPVSVQQFEVKPHSPYQRILQKDILFFSRPKQPQLYVIFASDSHNVSFCKKRWIGTRVKNVAQKSEARCNDPNTFILCT